jgi:transposase
MKKPTNKVIIETLEKTGGLIKPAATRLKVARNTLYLWISEDEELKQGLQDVRDGMVDIAEGMLFQSVQEKNLTAIIFTLKTLGKARGYVERQEIEVPEKLEISYRNVSKKYPDRDHG